MSQFSITTFKSLLAQVTGKKNDRFAAFAEGMGQSLYSAAENTLNHGSGALKQAVAAMAAAKGGKAAMIRQAMMAASPEIAAWMIIAGDTVTPASGYVGGNSPKINQAERDKRENAAIAFGNCFRDALLQLEAIQAGKKAEKKAEKKAAKEEEDTEATKVGRKGHNLTKTAKRMIALRNEKRNLRLQVADLQARLADVQARLSAAEAATSKPARRAAAKKAA